MRRQCVCCDKWFTENPRTLRNWCDECENGLEEVQTQQKARARVLEFKPPKKETPQ